MLRFSFQAGFAVLLAELCDICDGLYLQSRLNRKTLVKVRMGVSIETRFSGNDCRYELSRARGNETMTINDRVGILH